MLGCAGRHVAYGRRNPFDGLGEPLRAGEERREGRPAFEAAVPEYHVVVCEGLAHKRQPAVGYGFGIGRRGYYVLVAGGLDSQVEDHLRRYGIPRVLDVHDAQVGVRRLQELEVGQEVVVVADIYQHHLVGVVVLRKQYLQPLVEICRVLAEHRDYDRHRRFGVENLPAGREPEPCRPGIYACMVDHLHDECRQNGYSEGHSLPAVRRADGCCHVVDEVHWCNFSSIPTKIRRTCRNTASFSQNKAFCRHCAPRQPDVWAAIAPIDASAPPFMGYLWRAVIVNCRRFIIFAE